MASDTGTHTCTRTHRQVGVRALWEAHPPRESVGIQRLDGTDQGRPARLSDILFSFPLPLLLMPMSRDSSHWPFFQRFPLTLGAVQTRSLSCLYHGHVRDTRDLPASESVYPGPDPVRSLNHSQSSALETGATVGCAGVGCKCMF